ncbi:uncharacterized protein LOC129762028 [Toxorhynchites rutilus septentrionalis]|uniref:uncharacterized protein LOC129762028 n=1 Tax=Toxorhynchites rutilus septentrionalis TaxID=329112 RepID=UPI00247ADF02|nr:uncharacterized protein LOC129762028 [Toxorhynchites rutilus septentrionalis]
MISININIDGLPVHKSSKFQLWPILCNVHEFPYLQALPIGIFYGKSKPTDVNEFLTPFVDEIIPCLENGIVVNDHTISIKLRCFICDSPARAFVKGVVNFNGKDGCLKCTINGEYSYLSRTVVFPSLHCPLRTDAIFRRKGYGKHHTTQESPLQRIPGLDMIKDFVVADPLHLLELGVMKRLLTGWQVGNLGYTGKFSSHHIQRLSAAIESIKLPKEKFIEEFIRIYGEQYITSNIHNLEHIVGDVNQFGSLYTISAYPFESYLFQIKNLVRQGNNCLEQVVNRMLERNAIHERGDKMSENITPKIIRRGSYVRCEIKNEFMISNSFKDAWFLTKNLEIVKMIDATTDCNGGITLHGCPVQNYSNFFELPIRSSCLYIFLVKLFLKSGKTYNINDITCKFVAVPYTQNTIVLLPLLHTICAG